MVEENHVRRYFRIDRRKENSTKKLNLNLMLLLNVYILLFF